MAEVFPVINPNNLKYFLYVISVHPVLQKHEVDIIGTVIPGAGSQSQ